MTEGATGAASAGALLRAAREKQGLHIAALAASIKVAPRKLEALEADRYDELPDATFTRALAQTVCRTLKVDPRPVLDLLPRAPSIALEPGSGGLGTPFRERPGRDDPTLAVAEVNPIVWAALALVLAALAVYLVPGSWWSTWRSAPAAAPAPAAASAALPSSSALATFMPAATPASAAVAAGGETVFAAPAVAAAASEAGTAAPAGMVQLRSTEASWVEVRDARGQLLLSRTVLPGEGVGLDGALPLRLVIGNAAATQLGFRGQPIDLAPHTRDNIARVELP